MSYRSISECHPLDKILIFPLAGWNNLTSQYQAGGGLKSITDPFGNVTSYSADNVGRTTGVTGSGEFAQDEYVGGITYRAFGAVKSMSMKTEAATQITMTYDNALRPLVHEADNSTTGSSLLRCKLYLL